MTPIQKFLQQITLKQVEGSVYLVPSITNAQIEEVLKEEQRQLNLEWQEGAEHAQNDAAQEIRNHYTPKFRNQ